MKKTISMIIAVLTIFVCFAGRVSAADEYEAYILIEANSGIVIEEENSDTQQKVAGLSRMMSCLIFLESISAGKVKLTDEVTVSQIAAKKTGTRVFLDSGASYTFEELLKAAVMCSANDAVTALAEYLCGTEEAFTQLMNSRAKELGCSSVFSDCTGIDEAGTSMSAKDVMRIACEISKYPLFFQYSGIWMDTFTHDSGRTTEMVNQNRLVKSESIDGMATSSSGSQNYCIAASLNAGTSRFIVVILGSPNSNIRFTEANKALNFAQANYSVKNFAKKGAKLGSIKIPSAQKDSYAIYAKNDLSILIKKGSEAALKKEIEFYEIEAPLFAGDTVGKMTVSTPEGESYAVELVLSEDARKITLGSIIGSILRSYMGIVEIDT